MGREVGLYLNDGLRQDVAEGRHNFFRILTETFSARGFTVRLFANTVTERLASATRGGCQTV